MNQLEIFQGLPPEVQARNIERANVVVNHLNNAASSLIEAGRVLLEAKAELAGTRGAFGQWREQYLPGMSKMAASRLMRVAEKFGNTKSNTVLPHWRVKPRPSRAGI